MAGAKQRHGKKNNKATTIAATEVSTPKKTTSKTIKINPESIQGSDDMGNFYACHAELMAKQDASKEDWYAANQLWWDSGGYGGKTDDESMIGDTGGEKDGEEGLAFLDRLLLQHGEDDHHPGKGRKKNGPATTTMAMDCGAGVGRITKLVLLKRFDSVQLVEANANLSTRSKVYLGRKRAAKCHFTCANLQDMGPQHFEENSASGIDLIWVQWTLQYLTDADVIYALKTLGSGLSPTGGYLVVKENRPYGNARSDRFQMDTPQGEHGRYDITRSDAHHRLLFEKAGLRVHMMEQGDETNTYALTVL